MKLKASNFIEYLSKPIKKTCYVSKSHQRTSKYKIASRCYISKSIENGMQCIKVLSKDIKV